MPRPFLVRAFVDELPLKVLAMVLAVTLFVLVRNDKDSSSGAYVKVVYKVPDDKVLVSDPPTEAKVSVRGPWTQLQHLERTLEPLHVDLTHVRDGQGDVRLDEDALRLPEGVRVASISPVEVHVEMEPRVTREVPIQPLLEGEPAEGYRVAKVTATPPAVRVEGAKSAVEAMTRVPTRPLRVAEARKAVESEVPLEAAPAHTRFVEVTTVLIRADVQPAMVERVFDAVPVKVLGLSRMDAQLEPAAAKLTLRGPSVLLDEVTPKTVGLSVEAALIDTRPPSKYIRSVTVSGLPAGVAAEVQPDTVMLTTHRK
jgi:YbbR domain-containing protein